MESRERNLTIDSNQPTFQAQISNCGFFYKNNIDLDLKLWFSMGWKELSIFVRPENMIKLLPLVFLPMWVCWFYFTDDEISQENRGVPLHEIATANVKIR